MQIDADRMLRQCRDKPRQVLRARSAVCAASRAPTRSPYVPIAVERLDQSPEARIVAAIRHLAHAIDHHIRPQVDCKSHRRLRGQHAPLQIVGLVVTAPRGKRHRRNPQVQIVQQLVKLAQAGLRKLRRRQFAACIDLHAVGPQPGRGPQRLPAAAGEGCESECRF